MIKDPLVPRAWFNPMPEHLNQITNMAADWDLTTCLTWSERIFTMIEDGRLLSGWGGYIRDKRHATGCMPYWQAT